MTDRDEFEAWARTMKMDLTPYEETFDSDFTSNAWDGWQAARATAEQSEPTPEPFGYVYRIISEMRPHDPMYRFAKTGELNPDPEVVRSWTRHAVYLTSQISRSRDSAIEECAKVCDAMAEQCEDQQQFVLDLCSDAIRALKSQQDAAVESQRSGDGSNADQT